MSCSWVECKDYSYLKHLVDYQRNVWTARGNSLKSSHTEDASYLQKKETVLLRFSLCKNEGHMRACVGTHKHTRFLSHFLGTSLPSHIKADCSGSLLLLFTFPWFTPLPRALRTRQRQSTFPLTPLSWWLLKCPSEVTVVFSLGQWTFPFHGTNLYSTYSSVQGPELILALCVPWPSHWLQMIPPPGSYSRLTFPR